MAIKVIVAEDHDLVRTGMVRMLDDVKDIEVIGQAGTGEQAIQYARELEPDVILMDVKMPGIAA